MDYKEWQENLKKIFSKQIKKIRIDRDNDTQESFCKKHNISLRTVKKWESEEVLPSWESVVSLADSLNVRLDYFADRHTDEKNVYYVLREKGLSERAIGVIMDEKNKDDVALLSNILEHPHCRRLIQAMSLLTIKD